MAKSASQPLKGKRILVTRALEQSAALIDALRAEGALPISLPLLAFAPPDHMEPVDVALTNLSGFDWLFLTSQNAVRALHERCVQLRLSLAELGASPRIAAVGPATSDAAAAAGLSVAYVAHKHDGVSLAEELAAEVKGKRVFLPRSDRANPQLVTVLQKLGAHVTDVVAYKTISSTESETHLHEALLRESADAILFFSPSAVHRLRDLVGSNRFREFSLSAAFVAIGPVTGKALREAGTAVVLQAGDTTVAAILETLIDFFEKSGERLPAGVKPI